ncbi:MAG TPA: hypothetical protein VLA19_14235 [Herpetosiphonaceae bacterium]|nr:hypothetical protein [Herpetosiphonaceae bacterium]
MSMRRGGGTSAALDHAREIDIGLRYTVRMPDHAALGALTRATSPARTAFACTGFSLLGWAFSPA